MDIRFDPLALENYQQAESGDELLRNEFHLALEAIADETPRSRETALRLDVLGGTAWSIAVRVPGRDDVYQVIWVQPAGAEHARIIHLGRALQ